QPSCPASTGSPANISPVGPAPAITTACPVFDDISRIPCLPWLLFGRPFYEMTGVLKQAPCAPHIRVGKGPVFPDSTQLRRSPCAGGHGHALHAAAPFAAGYDQPPFDTSAIQR